MSTLLPLGLKGIVASAICLSICLPVCLPVWPSTSMLLLYNPQYFIFLIHIWAPFHQQFFYHNSNSKKFCFALIQIITTYSNRNFSSNLNCENKNPYKNRVLVTLTFLYSTSNMNHIGYEQAVIHFAISVVLWILSSMIIIGWLWVVSFQEIFVFHDLWFVN